MLPFSSLLNIFRTLPPGRPEGGASAGPRGSRYLEQMMQSVVPSKRVLADEGSYYVATNPTPGTGISTNAVETSFSDTRGFFVIGNTDSPSNPFGKRVYLDYLRLILLATAPTATVSQHFVLKRSAISREPTTAANRTLLTPANLASGSGRAPVARVMSFANAGAMTVPASSPSDPIVGRVCLPTGLGIAGDEYVLAFGAEAGFDSKPGGTAVRATDPARLVAHLAPVILEPGEWLVIHRYWLTEATNGPCYEFELAWWER